MVVKRLVLCGSMSLAKEMLDIKAKVETMYPDISVEVPGGAEVCASYINANDKLERAEDKIANDWIRHHWSFIKDSDAILVVNSPKCGVENYIGANSFMEMGFAHVLNRRIFILHDIPELEFYCDEIVAMKPICLHGELSKLKSN